MSVMAAFLIILSKFFSVGFKPSADPSESPLKSVTGNFTCKIVRDAFISGANKRHRDKNVPERGCVLKDLCYFVLKGR